MQQQFTKDFMIANSGCYDEQKLLSLSFMRNEDITLKSIVESEIPLRDKFWFVCKKLATKEENQQITINVAEIVLPIYEKHYPDNKAPREAIEAAKQYIAGHISLETLLSKRRAAAVYAVYAVNAVDAAYAAVYAADAAAAVYAAYAAAVYAVNAVDTAVNAAYAVDAAYAAAAVYDIKIELLNLLKNYIN